MREERTGRLTIRGPESRLSRERTPARPRHPTISKAAGTPTTVAGAVSSLPARPSISFIKADPNVRLSLVQDIVKSWDLATSGASDPPKVSEEEMFMAEGFARGVKAIAECQRMEGLVSQCQRRYEKLQADIKSHEKEMQRQLERAAADAVQAREQSYQQGRSETLAYLHKVLLTLATKFSADKY